MQLPLIVALAMREGSHASAPPGPGGGGPVGTLTTAEGSRGVVDLPRTVKADERTDAQTEQHVQAGGVEQGRVGGHRERQPADFCPCPLNGRRGRVPDNLRVEERFPPEEVDRERRRVTGVMEEEVEGGQGHLALHVSAGLVVQHVVGTAVTYTTAASSCEPRQH